MAFFAHNIFMIYLFGIITGIINGIFASGSGQILVFMYIYILKIQTHIARATSVFCIGLITFITIIRYITFVHLHSIYVVIVIFLGLALGMIGTKVMKKIPAKFLNIISGIIICIFSIYNILT